MLYKFIFWTFRGLPLIKNTIALELEKILNSVFEETGSKAIELEITENSVSGLVATKLKPEKLLWLLKGRSSKLLREKFEELKRFEHLWCAGYKIDLIEE